MSFADIKGQDKPISMLKAYIEEKRLGGAYLFCGAQGIGKKMAAFSLAKAVNCQDAGVDACGRCPSCLKIARKQHPDVHLFEFGEDEIKIECVRLLQREAALRPYEGEKKVFIIDNAHNLTSDASNALLKILEEPPKTCLIILISDKPNLIFKTILSRCKIMKFSPLPRRAFLDTVIAEWGLEHDLAHYLAYVSEGRIGSAISLRDQDILNEKNSVIDRLILSPAGRGQEFSPGERADMRRALNIVASWFRDVYIAKSGLPEAEFINFDRRKDLLKYAEGMNFNQLERIMGVLSESALLLDRNLNLKLLMHNLRAQIWKQ